MPDKAVDYTIVGAGAIGSLLAANLATNGLEVLLVDESDPRRAQVATSGVRVVGFKDLPTCHPPIVSIAELTQLPPNRFGTVVLAVPPREVAQTLDRIRNAVRPDLPLLRIVGGLGHIEDVSAWPGETVLGVVNVEARLNAGGDVEASFHNFIWLGNPSSTLTTAMKRMQRDLAWVGPTLTTKAIDGLHWGKALYALESSLPAFVNARPDEFFADEANRDAAVAIVREGIRIADALGTTPIAFDFFDPNLYRASTEGERATLHAWIHHAWQRHERFRIGSKHAFPATCGLSWVMSPKNPSHELTTLVGEFQRYAHAVGVDTPSLKVLEDMARQVREGADVTPSDLQAAFGKAAAT